jgi:hypothetical protein
LLLLLAKGRYDFVSEQLVAKHPKNNDASFTTHVGGLFIDDLVANTLHLRLNESMIDDLICLLPSSAECAEMELLKFTDGEEIRMWSECLNRASS